MSLATFVFDAFLWGSVLGFGGWVLFEEFRGGRR